MKILFTARAFDHTAGGVERMLTALMNEMASRGHTVYLLTLDREENTSFYPMDGRVFWYKLGIGDYRRKANMREKIQRFLSARRIIKNAAPDLIVSFMDSAFISALISSWGLGIPHILAERNAPQRFALLGEKKRWRFWMFRMADAITVQCPSYVAQYPAYLRARMTVIPNPVRPAVHQADPAGPANAPPTLLCVGRLSFQKNQSVLIDAFSQIAPQYRDWRLVLVGEGEDRPALEKQIRDKNPSDRITLTGAQTDVEFYYRQAQLFCLSSRFEGFPNALAEAMAHGLPCVGFAGCAGISDLIDEDRHGWLAAGNGDAATLAQSLMAAMRDPEARVKRGTAARQAMTAYEPKLVFDRWENLLLDLAGR